MGVLDYVGLPTNRSAGHQNKVYEIYAPASAPTLNGSPALRGNNVHEYHGCCAQTHASGVPPHAHTTCNSCPPFFTRTMAIVSKCAPLVHNHMLTWFATAAPLFLHAPWPVWANVVPLWCTTAFSHALQQLPHCFYTHHGQCGQASCPSGAPPHTHTTRNSCPTVFTRTMAIVSECAPLLHHHMPGPLAGT
eukprot:1159787-Pelagomonas_calceolata.AAC.5